jgi:COMPASS component SWD1
LIYIGTSQGYIYIFDTQTKQLVHSESISSPASIKDIEFDRTGTSLVVNSNDRSIRVYDILELAFYATAVPACAETLLSFAGSQSSEASTSQLPAFLTLRHRFQDLVNRTPWNAIGFTNDGDFIVGGAGHKAAQQVYVWDRANGSLSKILEGPKDCLDDFDVSKMIMMNVSF